MERRSGAGGVCVLCRRRRSPTTPHSICTECASDIDRACRAGHHTPHCAGPNSQRDLCMHRWGATRNVTVMGMREYTTERRKDFAFHYRPKASECLVKV